ncbi:MAG TPA: XamI family restriction endonuclease [Bacteroidota bacterium]|nr:XamI family restriction endonuclease [Bacteroidota bacterium]
MPINSDKPQNWKSDITLSVDFYNRWFMRFAPEAYRKTRVETTKQVESALQSTDNLLDIRPEILKDDPSVLPILRMATAPPIARDRLIGLAQVSPNLVKSMESDNRIPPQMKTSEVAAELRKIGSVISELADEDIFTWLRSKSKPTKDEVYRASTVVADRLCGAVADPIIRNAQEKRQLASVKKWLEDRGYRYIDFRHGLKMESMEPGTFSFRFNVQVKQTGRSEQVNIPIDIIIKPLKGPKSHLPILVEAKSAGDFANTNKRRKEEAMKVAQLRATYGKGVQFILFLCGYFDSGYLGYEAAEGIDWVWEHRMEDLAKLGL